MSHAYNLWWFSAFWRSPPHFAAKNAIFRSLKNANFVKNKFATNPEFSQFRQISSKINIFVTTASFRHFVSFWSKTKSFGAYQWQLLVNGSRLWYGRRTPLNLTLALYVQWKRQMCPLFWNLEMQKVTYICAIFAVFTCCSQIGAVAKFPSRHVMWKSLVTLFPLTRKLNTKLWANFIFM